MSVSEDDINARRSANRTMRTFTQRWRVLINPPCRADVEMSAFGGKADIEWQHEESPLLTQSGRGMRRLCACGFS
jgi:hypothetical protein